MFVSMKAGEPVTKHFCLHQVISAVFQHSNDMTKKKNTQHERFSFTHLSDACHIAA